MHTELVLFQGRAGDHNDLALPGARAIASAISTLQGLSATTIGQPEPALNQRWDVELEAARPALRALHDHFEQIYQQGGRALSASSRCAASVATLPVVARHHPDTCFVWCDAHADLNTPTSTLSGYLGGLALSGPLGLWDSGFGAGLELNNVILLGQHELDPFEVELMQRQNICHIRPGPALAQQLRAAVAGRPVYFHLDCDALDPGIVPTDYVCAGGLSLDDLHSAAEVLAQSTVMGLEIAEFQNAWTADGAPVSPLPLIRALMPLIHKLQAAQDALHLQHA